MRRARFVFCVLFVAAQAALIATAGRRSDRAFGFRMFAESTSLSLHVSRVLDDGGLLPIDDNQWEARDCRGDLHPLRWGRGLRFPAPGRLDETMPAPYGADAAIDITRGALAWIAAHTPEDCQTLSFVGELTLVRNGRALPPVRIDAPRTVGR